METIQLNTVLLLEPQKQQRFQDLLARFVELSEAELQELQALRQQHLLHQQNRQSEVEKIQQLIEQYRIQPSELFSAAQLKPSGRQRATATRRQSTPRRKWRKSDQAPVLLEMKPEGGRGRAFVYRKGRIYEGMAPNRPEPVYANLPARLAQYGASASSILSHLATDEGRDYFATPEGQAELNRIVEVVQQLKQS
ncbi:MAG TPA: hypothetical protein VK032_00370 [Burkholderiaceae bacterium]|nr:hypothetical protein [Burkholderiaceae bacterium]